MPQILHSMKIFSLLLLAAVGSSSELRHLKSGDGGSAMKNKLKKAKIMTGIYYGKSAPLGNGYVRLFVELDETGKPMNTGVEIDESAFEGLPTEPSDGGWDVINKTDGSVLWHCCGHEVVLDFPKKVADTVPFDFFILNWNPVGHGPPMVYDTPHFDLHFYLISDEERQSVPAPCAEDVCPAPPEAGGFSPVTCEDFERLTQPVPCDQRPQGIYANLGAVEPGMGNHLVPLGSSEFNGQPFTHTFIFGTQDGAVSFWEPMITLEYLMSLRDGKCAVADVDGNGGTVETLGSKVTVPIAMPLAAAEAGYYPSAYSMSYSGGKYRVTLEDMTHLPASDGSLSGCDA